MNKRILSFILTLIFVVSGFACTSFAQDEVESPAVSKDFEFAKAVGIFQEEYVPTEAISRIELAKCFSNIILKGVEPVLDNGSALFDDVDYADAGYADAMAGAGIMGGVGNRMFSPDQNVTYSQLLKVFVSFLGYDVKAQSLGGYPSGYMAVATELGLTDKNAPYTDSFVTYETLATMFKRALKVPLFNIIYYKEGTFICRQNENSDYLKEYLEIYRYSQVVNAVYNSNIINGKDIEYDEIILGDTLFRFDADNMDLNEKLGYKIEAFYTKETVAPKILFYDEYDNNVIILDGTEVEGYDDGVVYYEGKKEKTIKITTETNVLYNGTLCTTYDESLFNQWKTASKDGSLKAIDNNGDRNFDFVLIDAYDSYVVDTITDDVIIPMYRNGAIVDISSYIDGEAVLFRNIKGKQVSKDKVVSGCVISVSSDLDGNVKNIVVTTDTYTGEIEEVEIEDGKYYITVSGTRYNPSVCLGFNPQLTRLRSGEKVTMMFNKDGLLSDIETLKFQMVDTAYLVEAKTGKGLEASDKASIRIFSAGGFFGNYELADKVEILYGDEVHRLKPLEVLTLIGYEDSGKIKRQPLMYKRNKDGEIYWMSLCKEGSGPVDAFYKYENIGLSENYRVYGNSIEAKILLKSTPIFYVPGEENRSDETFYNVKTSLSNGNQANPLQIYGSKKDSRVASAVVVEAQSRGDGQTSSFMVVDSVTDALDPDGVPCVKVKGYVDGVLKEYFCQESVIKGEENIMPGSGDVITIKASATGEVVERSILYDYGGIGFEGTNPSATLFDERDRYLYGRLSWSDADSFLVEIDDGTGNLTNEIYLKEPSYRYYICEDLGTRGINIRSVKPAEVFAYPESYTKDNYVFMKTYYSVPQIIVIYK